MAEPWIYTGEEYDLGLSPVRAYDIFWDGTNWWVASGDSQYVYKYDSNWNYLGISYFLGFFNRYIRGIFCDGTNWWMAAAYGNIYKYDSNWNYLGISYYVGDQDSDPRDIFWDGTNWWMVGWDYIFKYDSNWNYLGKINLGSQDTGPASIFWDGTNWWMLGSVTDTVYKYDSNWNYTGESYYLGPSAEDIFWDGSNWWVLSLGYYVKKYTGPLPPPPTFININSTPTGASIYLDGNYIGITNSSYEIAAGTHSLKLTKSGYYDYTETFTISEGETKTFNITLEERPPLPEGLYEHFNTPTPGYISHPLLYGTIALTQSITIGLTGPNENFNITHTKVKLAKYGNPGIFIVSIRNSNAEGKPTGEDLSVGTLDGNTVTTATTNPQWYQINMSPYTLEAGKTYSLVFRSPEGYTSPSWNWICTVSDETNVYDNGVKFYRSTDSGVTWHYIDPIFDSTDYTFEIWGEPIVEEGFLDITGVTAPTTAHTNDLINFIVHTKNTRTTDNFKVELSGDLTASQEFSLGAGLTQDAPFSFTMPATDISIIIKTYHQTEEGDWVWDATSVWGVNRWN